MIHDYSMYTIIIINYLFLHKLVAMDKRFSVLGLAAVLVFISTAKLARDCDYEARRLITWRRPLADYEDPNFGRRNAITILFGSKLFDSVHPWFETTRVVRCSPWLECHVTSNKSLFNASDAVVIHARGSLSLKSI